MSTPAARSIILGTAGHIDHGKTALVRALTGINTDRLAEERRRGITIELGFAHLELGATLFGIVDVPGHERFIKSMVAGAGGLDIVMLVVAADEGVMPQTREHLDICQLLGVQRGMVALTKADLAEPDWLELVQDDLRDVLAGTFLAEAPIVPCSAVSGAGLDEILEALQQLSRAVEPRDSGGLLRLPLDRVFTIKGFGTVVTGTLLSGSIAPGDEVTVLPVEESAKVRSVQVHGSEVERALAGQRTAVNLGGVERQAVSRGEVVVHPGTFAPSSMIDAVVTLLPGARSALKQRSKVLFHIGTRQQEATCVLLDAGALEPGSSALAQLSFEVPIVALPGDRFILRGFRKQENYGTTLGGGQVLRVLSRRIRPRQSQAVELLGRIALAKGEERVALEVLGAGPAGLTRAELQQRLPLTNRELERQLSRLCSQSELLVYDKATGAVAHAEHARVLTDRMMELLAAFHAANPLEAGISREELRSRLRAVDPKLFARLLRDAESRGEVSIEQDVVRLAGFTVQTAANDVRHVAEQMTGLYARAGLGPPRDATLADELECSPAEAAAALKVLVDEGVLLKIGPLHFDHAAVEQLQARLVVFLEEHGEITPPEFKEMVGQSRKFFIPLAEYFDARKVTLRIGDTRKLRR